MKQALRKLRPKPSLVLEVAFMVVVWLGAWLIFDSVVIILIAIFGAYAIVFFYENWLDLDSREGRTERRRLKSERALERERVGRKEQPERSNRPIVKRFVTEVQNHELGQEEELPREVIAARAREKAERETEAAKKPPKPEPEPEREEPDPEPAPTLDESATPPPTEPEAQAPPASGHAVSGPAEPERRSLMAEFVASQGQGQALHTHAVGGWNVWQLERMMQARSERDEERDEERALLLVYLREFADADGQLPPELDEFVQESFGDLVRGPAGP